MESTEARDEHDKFEELCALAQSNSLSVLEQLELDRHLETCNSCRQLYAEYRAIGEEGMAFLSAEDTLTEEAQNWDNREARNSLFAAIGEQRLRRVLSIETGRATGEPRRSWSIRPSISGRQAAIGSLAACAILALILGAYRMGELAMGKSEISGRENVLTPQRSASLLPEKKSVAREQPVSADLLAAQSAQISILEKKLTIQEQEIARLRATSMLADEQASELGAVNGQREADVRRLTEERDRSVNQLAESEKAYKTLQVDYSNLRAEHDRYLLQTASLESELTDTRAVNQDQERRLKDSEQYLMSDRDIRELMGARKLYIADVFDVDSVSHTRKPFGRVFYTQSKTLVFYAFDLDHQPGVKNASVFQVWGQRDAETNGATHPMNLGILYMDSESNRRWVLRSDDPKQLSEIDAVFVTVEPHGGSKKPTGKPLLYALLRKEANHP